MERQARRGEEIVGSDCENLKIVTEKDYSDAAFENILNSKREVRNEGSHGARDGHENDSSMTESDAAEGKEPTNGREDEASGIFTEDSNSGSRRTEAEPSQHLSEPESEAGESDQEDSQFDEESGSVEEDIEQDYVASEESPVKNESKFETDSEDLVSEEEILSERDQSGEVEPEEETETDQG